MSPSHPFQLCAYLGQDSSVIDRITARHPDFDKTTAGPLEIFTNGSARPSHAVAGPLYALVLGRPYWSDESLKHPHQGRGFAMALTEAFGRSGDRVLDSLKGRFLAIVWNLDKGQGWAAIDRLGQMTLYWSETTDGLFFSDRLDGVLAGLAQSPGLSEQGLFDYCFFHFSPAPETLYSGINKLPAAHRLLFGPKGRSTEAYWIPAFAQRDSTPIAVRHEQLQQVLSESVTRARGDSQAFGAFLSGGLDSSTVAGHLSRQIDRPDSYTIGFEEEKYNELEYSRAAVSHFGLKAHEYIMQPEDALAALPTVAAHYDEPFGNSSALAAYYCAKLAVDQGKDLLLGGDGGDELFAGNERYVTQLKFEHWSKIPRPLKGLTRSLFNLLPEALPIVGKARSYIHQAEIPLPARLQSYNFLKRIDPIEIFEPDFLATIDQLQPDRFESALFERPQQANLVDRMLYLDWQYTLSDNDIRKVSGMCELAGIEVTYPFLDDAVVEFSNQIPASIKVQDRQLRHFYKQAMRGFLPDKIIDKPKHGFGLPFGLWLADHQGLHELASDCLNSLGQRGFIRPSFITKVHELHRRQHAAYYGELVWILVVLELWLTSRARPSRA